MFTFASRSVPRIWASAPGLGSTLTVSTSIFLAVAMSFLPCGVARASHESSIRATVSVRDRLVDELLDQPAIPGAGGERPLRHEHRHQLLFRVDPEESARRAAPHEFTLR